MDINLLKTFLQVHRTRHFGRAAEALYITQSAVSARIRLLEGQLGAPLFDRRRKDIQLTAAGLRFLPHAEQLMQAWTRACQETAQAQGQQLLAVGGVPGLWDAFLPEWMDDVIAARPGLTMSVYAEGAEALMRRLVDGAIDIAFLYEPVRLDEFVVRELGSVPVVLVADRDGLGVAEAMGPGYIEVDWGAATAAQLARHFPEAVNPTLRVNLGRIACGQILRRGGAAYLALPLVSDLLRRRRLFRVTDAPMMARAAYAVYASANTRADLIKDALASISGLDAPAVAVATDPGP